MIIFRKKVSIVTLLALSLMLGTVGLGSMGVEVGYVNGDGVLALADASHQDVSDVNRQGTTLSIAAVDPECFSECYGDCFHECIQTAPKSSCITECNQLYNECVAECPCVPTWSCRPDPNAQNCQVCYRDNCDGTSSSQYRCTQ